MLKVIGMTGLKMKRALAALACALSGGAFAAVDQGENGGELILYLWDPVARVSYTKDLGISMDTFFVSGQQDAGTQQFWQLAGADDTPFASFRAASTAENTRWALFGLDSKLSNADRDAGLSIAEEAGAMRIFTTLTNTTTVGVPGAAHTALTSKLANDFWIYASATGSILGSLVPGADSTHALADHLQNGSSFDREGTPQYIDSDATVLTELTQRGSGVKTTNKLGESSWFYAITSANDYDSLAPAVVDEFDNLGHDAYWGLVRDPATNNYVLSYTLAAATQSRMQFSPIGTARAAVTEYLASTGDRLLDTPSGAYDGYVPIDLSPVAAVPEPAACLLFGTGVLALIARRRSHKTTR
jgi:hypothetical protein